MDQQMATSASISLSNDGTFCINNEGILTAKAIYNTNEQLEKRIKILENKINNNNGNKKYKIVMGE